MRRLRILQVIQNLNYGGMERLLADIVRQVDSTRFESHVLALGYLGRFAEGLEATATLHVAPRLRRHSFLWPGPLIRLIREIGPDVVHMHSGVWYKTSLAARAAGVPRLIFTEHGRAEVERYFPRLLDRLSANRTDVVVAVSAAVAGRLRDSVLTDRARIVVIENGVDTDLFGPRQDNGNIRRELGIARDTPILGSVGRLEHIKGYDVMLEAYALLRRNWTGEGCPALVIGGDGSEHARCTGLKRQHQLDQVHLLGWRDDIHDLHSAFDLFTMASRSEGTSVSLLEAMSAGLCPVVTDVGGNSAVLGEALRHRLVPREDPAALAAAWRDALEDPARRSHDAARARARVQQAFSLDRMVRRYEELYAGG